jgi:opacity protein-like surface antigen
MAALLACAWRVPANAQTFVDIPAAPPADDVQPGFDLFAAAGDTYDDNLYKLPSSFTVPAQSMGAQSRSDHIEDLSAGATERAAGDRENFALDLRVSHDRYLRNSDLDNTAGNGNLLFNWGLTSLWSGQLSADYSRALVNFATTREFQRDLLDTVAVQGSVRFEPGPRWSAIAKLQNADTSHSLDTASSQNSHVTSGALGAEFAPSEDSSVELDYRYTKARFPEPLATAGGVQGDFDESTTLLLVEITPSEQASFAANAGYLKQSYVTASLSPYAGDIWHASFTWNHDEHTRLVLAASRDLSAYVAAASEYFVDQGESLGVIWTPRASFSLTLAVTWDDQDYLPGANQLGEATGEGFLQRHDRVRSQRIAFAYTPRDWLEADLGVRLEQRASNDVNFVYDDRSINLGLKIHL